jgi:threonine synthase
MIGDPVSFPKVRKLVDEYFNELFLSVDLEEQEIIECMLEANCHGHVVCTQGGESIAGLKKALAQGIVRKTQTVVVDSTSHQLKFSNFQDMYFKDTFPEEYEIKADKNHMNAPVHLAASSETIAGFLKLKKKC